MRLVRTFVMLAMLAVVPLSGCADITRLINAASTVGTATVDPRTIIVARDIFNGVEVTATNYLRLKRCGATTTPVCRDPDVTAKIIPAVYSGRAVRNSLTQFLRAHPGELGPKGLYDALIQATDTLQLIFTQYNIH